MVLITDFEDDDEDDAESIQDEADDAESIPEDKSDDPELSSVDEDIADVVSEIDASDEPDDLSTGGSEETES